MRRNRQVGAVNLKAVVILLLIVVVAGASVVTAHYVRKGMIADDALASGNAAYEKQDWETARTELRRYLAKYPDNIEILEKYAKSQVNARPATADNVAAAIGAYRRMLRLDPKRRKVYDSLADFYIATRNFNDLAYIARLCQENFTDDPKAAIWLATAFASERKPAEAERELNNLLTRLESSKTKVPEYVDACAMLSQIAMQSGSQAQRAEAQKYLDRATEYDPKSATAYLYRARYYRLLAEATPEDREHNLKSAREDLERAHGLDPDDPLVHLALSHEWLTQREFDRARAELDAADATSPEKIAEVFSSPDDWEVMRFNHWAGWALQVDTPFDRGKLADGVLEKLKFEQQRTRVLPLAIMLYVRDGRLADARKFLDEYAGFESVSTAAARGDQKLTLLQAIVARAEGKPYKVVALLEDLLNSDQVDAKALELLADAYAETKQDRRAAEILARYVRHRSRPDDPGTALEFARQYMRMGQWEAAIRLAGTLGSDNIEGQLVVIESTLLNAARQGDAAIDEVVGELSKRLDELHAADSDNVGVRVLKAAIALYREESDSAEKELRDAIEQCSDSLPAELACARMFLKMSRVDDALEICRSACERHADAASPWMALSEMLESLERLDEARETLVQGVEKAATPQVRHELGVRLALFDLIHERRQEGIDRLTELARENPDDVVSRSYLLDVPEIASDPARSQTLIDDLRRIQGDTGLLWRVYKAAGLLTGENWSEHSDEIRDLLEHCLHADPGWSAAAVLLGQFYRLSRDFEAAEQTYRRALAADPGAAGVAYQLLSLLQEQRRYSDARRVLDQLNASIYVGPERRIQILENAGDVGAAIDMLQLRVANDASDVASRVALARLIYVQQRNAESALDYLDEADSIAGPSMMTTLIRGIVLRCEERIEEARREMDASVERTGEFDAYLNRARFRTSIGEEDLAEKDCIHLTTFENRPDAWVLLGRFYDETNRPDKAVESWEQGLALYPDDTNLKISVCTALIARKSPEDRQRGAALLAELEQEELDDPQLIKLLMARARLKVDEQTDESRREAQQLLEKAIVLNPGPVEPTLRDAAYQLMIDIADQRGDPASVRDLAIRALEWNPRSADLLIARARAEARLQNHGTARSLLKLALENSPGNTRALHLMIRVGMQYNDKAMLSEAKRLIEEAMAKTNSDPRLVVELALAVAAIEETDQAVDALFAKLKEDEQEDAVSLLTALSNLYQDPGLRNNPVLADRCLELAGKLAPSDPLILATRIDRLGQQGDLDQVAALVSGDTPDPPYTPELLISACSYLVTSANKAHRDVALGVTRKLLKDLPSLSPLRTDIAGLTYRAGEVDQAEQICRDVLAADPDNPRALNDLAWFLADGRRAYTEALELTERGLKTSPNHRHLLDTRGVIYSNLPGRLDDARRDFEQCVSLTDPKTRERAKALLQVARVCSRLDRQADVRRALKEGEDIHRKVGAYTDDELSEIESLQAKAGGG